MAAQAALLQAIQSGSLKIDPEALKAAICLDSLADFTKAAWPIVEPGLDIKWNWHLDVLCDVLERVTRNELKRAIINIPPGASKSLMVSVFWPAWEWARDPSGRYLTASYSDANSIRDNRRVRSIVVSDWFQRHYPTRISGDQWAKLRLDTKQKGWRIATSVGGVGTGEHPDRIIIDDPIKASDSRSAQHRLACIEWYTRTISTRMARDPAVVIVMQRLHEDDLAGYLLNLGGWEHLMLPMRFDPDRADPRDQRTKAGELLWPSLWPESKVRIEELELGPYGTAGQLQQIPAPEGGGLFKREWLEVIDAKPQEKMRSVRGWDTAATEDGGDWTVGVKMSVDRRGIYYVEHVERCQLGPAGVDKRIKALAELDGRSTMIREEQEGGSAGKAVIQARANMLAGYDYSGVSITGDKVTRAGPFRAQCEAGNVRLIRGEWNEPYLQTLCSFPVGAHDDDVDASSCAFNAIALEPNKSSATWGRRG